MQFAHTQTIGRWKTTGNVVDSTAFIGTNNASCLRFRSYNEERMRITASGKVGIGVAHPQAKLQVKGNVQIDSSLVVSDAAVFKETAHIKGNLQVDGDVNMSEGALTVHSLIDTSLHAKGLLMVDETGKVVNVGRLGNAIYGIPTTPVEECLQDINGNTLILPPLWQHENHGMFLLKQPCHYSSRLGVGVKPTAKLQVRLEDGEILTPLVIEKYKDGNVYKLLQLDNSGTLHSREVKVDLASWRTMCLRKTIS